MASPVQISVAQLNRLVGTPGSPILIDVRIDEDFTDDPRILPAAIRHPHQTIDTLIPEYREKSVVVYCQKGLKLSSGAAAILRAGGVNAESLEGGHFAWRDADNDLTNYSKIPWATPQSTSDTNNGHYTASSLWVTRLRPKIDRIACPWLIRRFIDRNARFLYVASADVKPVAEKFNATPFDIEDTFWSHRGDQCTFDTMLHEFGLTSPALKQLATIVRGADTDNHSLAPESSGLLAASLGLSRMYSDDLQQLDAGMLLYDAFYRWARDATTEKHNWPS